MELQFNMYETFYSVSVFHNDGDVYTCISSNLDNVVSWWFSLFDDTYTITHEFMKKYEQYKKGETV